MSEKLRGTFATIGLLSFLLIGFQNCGEQPALDGDPVLQDSSGQIVQISDQWITEKVKFYETDLQLLPSLREVEVSGFCHRQVEGNNVAWALTLDDESESYNVLQQGEVECSRAGFTMKLVALESLECGQSYNLHIEVAEGDEDMMTLVRDCTP